MTRASKSFTTKVVGVALVIRLAAIMVSLYGLMGSTITGPLLSSILLLSASTFAMLMYPVITDLVMRHPILLVVDVLLNLAVVWLLGVESPLVLTTFSTALILGILMERRIAVLGAVVMGAGYLLVALSSPEQPAERGFMTQIGVPALYASLIAVGAAVRSAHEQQVATSRALADAERQAAAADERARLAREMHDSLGKTLHGLSLGAQGLVGWIERDPERARVQALALADGAARAAQEARELLVRMRTDQPDRPLVEVLSQTCAAWQAATGVTCAFTAVHAVDLPTSVRYDALAVVSEALENVARHADARRVEVRLEDAEGAVRITVRDDGAGFRVPEDGAGPEGHYGLVGMHERARSIGADLDVVSRPGAGASVALTWRAEDERDTDDTRAVGAVASVGRRRWA